MRIKYNTFEHELKEFLKSYLEISSFEQLQARLDGKDLEQNPDEKRIKDFYRDQLNIDYNQSNDRIQIDRVITFAQKVLNTEKFSRFLIELGHICISEGKYDIANDIFIKSNKLTNDNCTKAESFLGISEIFVRRAKWTRSMESIKKAQALFKIESDALGIAKCENALGTIYGELGDINKAKKHFMTGLSLINRNEDVDFAANLYTNLGIVYNIQGFHTDSLNHLNKALGLYKSLSKHKNIAEINLNIGIVNLDSDNYDNALEALDTAVEISKEYHFVSVLCLAYHVKSQVLIKMEDYSYASEFANKALEMSHDFDDKLTVADIYKVKGVIERNLGNYILAETNLLNSLRINESMNNEINVAETSFELGLLYDKMDHSKLKNNYLTKSKEYYKNIDSPVKVERIENILAFS